MKQSDNDQCVKVKCSPFIHRFSRDYRNEIDRHAREGWRFVQALAPSVGLRGHSNDADLILEKPLTGKE